MQNINAQGWKQLLSKNPSFHPYGNNAIGLLALALRFNIDDISYAGSESLVDGSNDKKNDFIYIDEENKIAIIIQAFFSKVTKHIAPANKASDLNTAILWLLSSNDSELPEGIKQHALKLRNGIKEGTIKKIQVWYVHNCTESENVKRELNVVKLGLNNLIKSLFKENNISTDVLEVGSSTLSEWYLQSFSPIYVSEDVNFTCTSGFEVNSENWDSFVTTISARELYFLYQKHKSALFSANIRDYLGDRDTNSNINSGIKSSIRKSPNEFWAYNNGLTVLTNSFNFEKEKNNLILNGVSIVNGAQTTGAIGNLAHPPKHETQILVRFIRVKNSSKSLVGNIVRYNNSQNKVDASDFRSNDSIQKRLITEINLIDRNTKYLERVMNFVLIESKV